MIRHGRRPINRPGIAALHGLRMTAFKGKRRRQPPWEEPGHPRPINQDPAGTTKPRTWLYDEQQARAYAAGQQIRPLPAKDHPKDLLTEREAAAYLGMDIIQFRDLVKSQRMPLPDDTPFGVNHWYRRTLDQVRERRRGGRRRERAPDGRTARQRMKAVVDALPAAEDVSPTDLARRAAVALSTARAFLRQPELRITATFTEPIGPDVPQWNNFVADVHKLAQSHKYADLAIRLTED